MIKFNAFPKVPRLSRECIITEKLDGTNASIWIERVSGPENPFDIGGEDCFMAQHDGFFYAIAAASRSRFLVPEKSKDNFGFAGWVRNHVEELVMLGEGVHYGEWWGRGIQRGYGLDEKRFSLFNTGRWFDAGQPPGPDFDMNVQTLAPLCCHVVPMLWKGQFDLKIQRDAASGFLPPSDWALRDLRETGSIAAPGFLKPEGIMIFHTAANSYFKKTFEGDLKGKGQ